MVSIAGMAQPKNKQKYPADDPKLSSKKGWSVSPEYQCSTKKQGVVNMTGTGGQYHKNGWSRWSGLYTPGLQVCEPGVPLQKKESLNIVHPECPIAKFLLFSCFGTK